MPCWPRARPSALTSAAVSFSAPPTAPSSPWPPARPTSARPQARGGVPGGRMPCRSRGPGPGGPRLRLALRRPAGESTCPACIRFRALAGLVSLDSAASAEALRLLAAAGAGPRLLGAPAPRPLAPVCSAPPAPEPPASHAHSALLPLLPGPCRQRAVLRGASRLASAWFTLELWHLRLRVGARGPPRFVSKDASGRRTALAV